MLAWFGDVEGCEPFMPAVRWFEAAMAAAEGSKVVWSAILFPAYDCDG